MNIIVPHGFEPNYTLGFVKGLLDNGIDLCVIASDLDYERIEKAGALSVNLRGSQDTHRTIAAKVINLVAYYLKLGAFVVRHRHSVMHFTGLFQNRLFLLDGLLLNSLFRLLSKRYIYTVHNVLPHSKLDSHAFKALYKLAYRLPHVLLVHTQQAREQLISDFAVPSAKIHVISIGLNEEVPTTGLTREQARRVLGLPQEDSVVLFFGKGEEYKGLDVLVRALDCLEVGRVILLVATWFPVASYRKTVFNAISVSTRKEHIVLHEGFVPNADVERYFKAADVVCLPYRSIYQSGVVFLSMAFGTPIVATDAGSLRKFVRDDAGVIAEQSDAVGIAAAIDKFFRVKDRFSSEHIRTRAGEFSWTKICKQLVGLYQLRERKGGNQ